MGEHNRLDAGRALLGEIDAWCKRTESAETLVGRVLFRHGGFVGLLRKRLTVSPEKEAAVRAFLATNPEGWDGQPPKCSGFGVTRPLRSSKVRLCKGPVALTRGQTVVREGMEAEVRATSPALRRFTMPAGVMVALSTDGRPAVDFLEALIWMGLECWKDDREAHQQVAG